MRSAKFEEVNSFINMDIDNTISLEEDITTFDLDEVCLTVASVCKNLNDTLVDIVSSENYDISEEVKEIQQITRSIQENITFVVTRSPVNGREMPMIMGTNKYDAVQEKYNNLQREWDSQQEQMGKLQGEMYKLRNQLKNQSSYCAALGATLGKLIWKVSKLPEAAEMLLKEIKLNEFLSITSGTLGCFIDTYSTGLPDRSANEVTFILSIMGAIANIAACPDGREFLTSDPNGQALIQQIFEVMPKIHDESGDSLQRVLMMALYNISINQKGFIMMQGETKLLQTITRYILNNRCPELKLMSLRLLMSLSVHIASAQIYKIMVANISLKEIIELQNTTDAEMRTIATTIVKHFDEAEAKFKTERTQPLQVYPEDCRLLKNQLCCNGDPVVEPQFNPFLARSNN